MPLKTNNISESVLCKLTKDQLLTIQLFLHCRDINDLIKVDPHPLYKSIVDIDKISSYLLEEDEIEYMKPINDLNVYGIFTRNYNTYCAVDFRNKGEGWLILSNKNILV